MTSMKGKKPLELTRECGEAYSKDVVGDTSFADAAIRLGLWKYVTEEAQNAKA
jgi:hypothetical protein